MHVDLIILAASDLNFINIFLVLASARGRSVPSISCRFWEAVNFLVYVIVHKGIFLIKIIIMGIIIGHGIATKPDATTSPNVISNPALDLSFKRNEVLIT
jgi:hypothetical protein